MTQKDSLTSSDGSTDLARLVGELKEDPQGPFESIGWFCADGTTNPGDEPCDSVGGIRHGVHKDQVTRIARSLGIYLGQVLACAEFDVFLDEHRFFSRALRCFSSTDYSMSYPYRAQKWQIRHIRDTAPNNPRNAVAGMVCPSSGKCIFP